MKKIFFLILFLPLFTTAQRAIDDGVKLTKADALAWLNEIYHSRFFYVNDFINTVTTSAPGNDLQATNSGTSAATSTQATDGAGRETGFGWLLLKSVGTTARTVDFDYLSAQCAFTTAR